MASYTTTPSRNGNGMDMHRVHDHSGQHVAVIFPAVEPVGGTPRPVHVVEMFDRRGRQASRFCLSQEDAFTFIEWTLDGRWDAVRSGDAPAPIPRAY